MKFVTPSNLSSPSKYCINSTNAVNLGHQLSGAIGLAVNPIPIGTPSLWMALWLWERHGFAEQSAGFGSRCYTGDARSLAWNGSQLCGGGSCCQHV